MYTLSLYVKKYDSNLNYFSNLIKIKPIIFLTKHREEQKKKRGFLIII